MYQTTFKKLGNGQSLNNGQIIYLCACYDLMTFDGCSDDCKPTQILLQCIQERRSLASSSGKSGGSRGSGGGGSGGGGGGGGGGERNMKNRKSAQAKAEARQDVYTLLSSMGKECKLTMPEVDVAIPDGRIAIKVIGVEGYAKFINFFLLYTYPRYSLSSVSSLSSVYSLYSLYSLLHFTIISQ